MPDSQTPRAMAPHSWAEAFAALPDAAPPGDGWARVAHALDAPTVRKWRAAPRHRWPLWLATAAALAVVAVVPFGLMDNESPLPLHAPTAATTPSVVVARRAAPTPATNPRDAKEDPPAARNEARQLEAAATRAIKFAPVKPRARPPARAVAAPSSPAPQSAAAESPPPANAALLPGAIANVAVDPLLQLQAESAQLEALVAFARDERVASASSAVLAGELDTRIGLIDAALSQTDVSSTERAALWQQRIDTLRDLAGVETTQRWLAARGERYDGALVRVD